MFHRAKYNNQNIINSLINKNFQNEKHMDMGFVNQNVNVEKIGL